VEDEDETEVAPEDSDGEGGSGCNVLEAMLTRLASTSLKEHAIVRMMQ